MKPNARFAPLSPYRPKLKPGAFVTSTSMAAPTSVVVTVMPLNVI